jgi:hypothetical protein
MAMCLAHASTENLLQNLMEFSLSKGFPTRESFDGDDTFEARARSSPLAAGISSTEGAGSLNTRPLGRASTFGQTAAVKRPSEDAVKHYKEV